MSLFGVMTAVSSVGGDVVLVVDLVERRLELAGLRVHGELVHHRVVHHERQAVDEAFLGDVLGLEDARAIRALVCALAGTDFVAVTLIAASAAERRRSRFVNMVPAPLQGMIALARSDAGAEAPACGQLSLGRNAHRCLRLHDRRRIPFAGQRFRLRRVEAHRQIERSLRRGKPVGFECPCRGSRSGNRGRANHPALYLNGIQLLTAKRFSVLPTWNPS